MKFTGSNINSVDYWDNRFIHNWEENAGKLQTLYFYNIALQLIPDWMHVQLNSGITLADIGCAEGDGVDLFSKKYQKSNFVGLDFSKEAIKKPLNSFQIINFSLRILKISLKSMMLYLVQIHWNTSMIHLKC